MKNKAPFPILAIISRKHREFNRIFQMATELNEKLSWVPKTSNGMDKIVEFFQIVSPVQDEGKKTYRPLFKENSKERIFFDEFAKFLSNAGRNQYGWNRTDRGQTPSSSTTYINMRVPYDEIYNTRSVAEHLSRRNNPKGEVDYALKESAHGKYNECCLIEKEFVNPFMIRNYEHLAKILKDYREAK